MYSNLGMWHASDHSKLFVDLFSSLCSIASSFKAPNTLEAMLFLWSTSVLDTIFLLIQHGSLISIFIYPIHCDAAGAPLLFTTILKLRLNCQLQDHAYC